MEEAINEDERLDVSEGRVWLCERHGIGRSYREPRGEFMMNQHSDLDSRERGCFPVSSRAQVWQCLCDHLDEL